jgi:hypothetical protein
MVHDDELVEGSSGADDYVTAVHPRVPTSAARGGEVVNIQRRRNETVQTCKFATELAVAAGAWQAAPADRLPGCRTALTVRLHRAGMRGQ